VHSREKLWSITIFCPGRKKEEEEGEKLVLCLASFLWKDPLYSSLVEEENSNNIKYGSKTGAEIMGLERIMTLMVEDQVKKALI